MKRLAEEGMTMIVVTHEMSFARRVADQVVVFESGAVIEAGPRRRFRCAAGAAHARVPEPSRLERASSPVQHRPALLHRRKRGILSPGIWPDKANREE